MHLEQDIIDLVAAQPGIKLAILFGSLSRGQGRVDSDLDMAIAESQALTAAKKKDLIGKLAQITGRPVDLIDLQTASGTILKQILTTGRLIYCMDRTLYAEIIKKMLFDQADLMPYRDRILTERRRAWIGD